MNSIKSKHIIIGLVVAFILFLFSRIGDEDYSYDNPGAHTLGNIPTKSSYRLLESEQAITSSSTWSYNPTIPTRHEILQTKVKGYRESTYWGSEHPTHEKVRHFSDDEFDQFIENVELNDADVFWGAEY